MSERSPSAVFDRYRAEQHRAFEITGRMIVVFLALLAVIQFAILGLDGIEGFSSARLLLIGVGIAMFWSFAPWIWQYLVARHNPEGDPRARLGHAWGEYGLLPIFGTMLSSAVIVLGAAAENQYNWTALATFYIIAIALDVGGFTALQIRRPGAVFLVLLPLRFVIASALAVMGAQVIPDHVTNLDRVFFLWPAIAAGIFAQWTVWMFIQHGRQIRNADALRTILDKFHRGDSTSSGLAEEYDDWQRTVVQGRRFHR